MSIPWTPEYIDTALWLDAADSSTITESSGAVSAWADKSGNGRHAVQATEANKPIYSESGFSGNPGVAFDGSNDVLTASQPITGSNPRTVLAVFSVDSLASNVGIFDLAGDIDTAGGRWSVAVSNGGLFWVGCSGGNRFFTPVLSTGTLTFASVQSPGTDTNTITARINGSAAGISSTIAYATSLASSFFTVGKISTVGYGDVNIFEVIVLDYEATVPENELLEGYLAHKWGLSANLPSDHPYKSAAPTQQIISNTATTPIKDDTGAVCVRDILLVPRDYPTHGVIKTTSNASGQFSVTAESGVEYDVLILDDDTGTQYGDILISRVTPG